MKIGVEIEAIFDGVTSSSLSDAINAHEVPCHVSGRAGVANNFKVTLDGSVANGYEVVSPPLVWNDDAKETIKKVCAAMNSKGATIRRNCGLHVHIDVSNFSVEQVRAIFQRYADSENIIDSMMPVSRRANNNSYCKSIIDRVKESPSRVTDILRTSASDDRYFKVNPQSYSKFKTIEFRQHSGTTNAEKIINWIDFLTEFVAFTVDNVAGVATSPISNIVKQRVIEFATRLANVFPADARTTVGHVAELLNLSPVTVARYIDILNKAGRHSNVTIASSVYRGLVSFNRNGLEQVGHCIRNYRVSSANVDRGCWTGISDSVKSYYDERIQDLSGAR